MSAAPAAVPAYAKAPTQVLGRRGVALFIDSIIVAAIVAPLSISSIHVHDDPGNFHVVVDNQGLLQLVGLSVGVLYWWILESAFGATVGKFITGIRVRTSDGTRAGVGRCFVRNIIRIVPLYWFVGWIVAMASGPRRTRTFDMVARTVVIRSTYAT